MKKHTNPKQLAAAKAEFLKSMKQLKGLREKAKTAREAVEEYAKRALNNGATEEDLRDWLIEAGWAEKTAKNVVSALMLKIRKPKRSRASKVPAQAKALLAYAVRKYGEDAMSFLLSAYRYAKQQEASEA